VVLAVENMEDQTGEEAPKDKGKCFSSHKCRTKFYT
jgi:hypothetical protein